MEYRLNHKLVGFENFSIRLSLKKLTKSAKNRSYANLSPCCKSVLKQKKFCGACNTEIGTDLCTHKEFKVGKEKIAIPSKLLDDIKERLDDNKITITEYRTKDEINSFLYTDVMFQAEPAEKGILEYSEFYELLKNSGKLAVGTINYNARPYPCSIELFNGSLILRAMHFSSELTYPSNIPIVQVNSEKIELLNKLLAMNMSRKGGFDINLYVNEREKEEEGLIIKVMNGEKLPEISQEPVRIGEQEEIARLKAMLETA